MSTLLAAIGIVLVEGLQNAPAWAAVFTLRAHRAWVRFLILMVATALIIELTEPLKLRFADQPIPTPRLDYFLIMSLVFILAGFFIVRYLNLTDHLRHPAWIDLAVAAVLGFLTGFSEPSNSLVHGLAIALVGVLTVTSLRLKHGQLLIISWAVSSLLIALLDYIIPYLL